jgi:hypothetical protein
MAVEDLRVPFVEFERAALCSGEVPDPFAKGLEVPFELLLSPSNLILEPSRLRFRRCSFSLCCTSTESVGLSYVCSCLPASGVRLRRLRPRIGAGKVRKGCAIASCMVLPALVIIFR